MSMIWLITPAFCKWELLADCLKHIYATPPRIEFQHIIIDNRYPANQEINSNNIARLANEYGCTYVDSGRDLGLHHGINNAAAVVGIKPADVVVGCDPDDRPSPGFVDALAGVMRREPQVAVAAANFWVIEERNSQGVFKRKTFSGEQELWIHPSVEMWGVCAFNWQFITEIGGLRQPNEYYGGLEAALYPEMVKRRMVLAYLPDVRADAVHVDREDRALFDPEYRQWKTAHVGGYTGSFAHYLQEFHPAKGTP